MRLTRINDQVLRLLFGDRSAYASFVMASNIAVKGVNNWGRPNWLRVLPCASNYFCTSFYATKGKQFDITKGMDRSEMKGRTKQVFVSHASYPVSEGNILKKTTHRDGSIYKINYGILKLWHLTQRDETQLEPMMFSNPMNCFPDRDRCMVHSATAMMQIFSLKLEKASTNIGLVQLYGYIAVRDCHDSLLNYVFNRSRDDPIIVEQGSLIEMTGPKRGIAMVAPALVEFDMRIKKGKQEDDLQLIDGAVEYHDLVTPEYPFTHRINGDCGAVDITLALVRWAFEATIDVVISKVQCGFDLSLSSCVFLMNGLHEIQLFRGSVVESCGLRRYVIAVKKDTLMYLKFKVGQNSCKNDLDHHCSFKAKKHGHDYQQIMLELASISVKVTWSNLQRSGSSVDRRMPMTTRMR
ncbi:uncharacterized protein LOC125507447 isoform X2 [Triticum urartu]|uniref:uncharacterized protein LOC125507447 isoform X2 n=1 Tax=Triticum urartu TaxID=4572 RepID=UPI0020439124|nr:uncharacterized protein LOC125507447 isoform X2 [Triticum urartu]